MAKHRTARQWASLLRRYESSGLTQRAFCQRQGIALSTLTYHLRRNRRKAGSSAELEATPKLVELKLEADESVARAGAGAAVVRIELDALGNVPILIHCQSAQVGEILAQVRSLPPRSS
jgi:hypothetical protein